MGQSELQTGLSPWGKVTIYRCPQDAALQYRSRVRQDDPLFHDFGDSWDHVIKLEKWFDNTTTEGLPLLLEAAGRCPPEEVSGAPGYAEYLDAISEPARPEHERMRLWGHEQFDPAVVDRKALEGAVNALSGICKPRRHKLRSK
ncbi:plasmid pRiA4b ORF-3 family protein [Bradyrhizobium sp. 142]|uniref:plasmid pRiA4b ORF-3 family protein n=1 Tax=Bradyrhizobium sp. 142 TaxID=2782618 RepID=UPI001FFA7F19|nr:plasmid pRiA4b ORF-3 family protein [Bradyrhizobium sp. 142]